MQLSRLIPEPFNQLLVSQAELKELLKTHDKTDEKVLRAATRVLVAENDCSGGLLAGLLAVGAVMVPLVGSFVDPTVVHNTTPRFKAAFLCLLSGGATIILLVHATTSSIFPTLGLVSLGIHSMFNKIYRQDFESSIEKQTFSSDFLNRVIERYRSD